MEIFFPAPSAPGVLAITLSCTQQIISQQQCGEALKHPQNQLRKDRRFAVCTLDFKRGGDPCHWSWMNTDHSERISVALKGDYLGWDHILFWIYFFPLTSMSLFFYGVHRDREREKEDSNWEWLPWIYPSTQPSPPLWLAQRGMRKDFRNYERWAG